MPPRCFLGCSSDVVEHLHVFPNPTRFPEQFKKWVQLVGGQLNTPDDYVFFRKQRLCNRHFAEKDDNRNNRLNALAVPSLFLKAVNPVEAPTTRNIAGDDDKIHLETVEIPLLQSMSLIDQTICEGDPTETVQVFETETDISLNPLLQATSLIGSLKDAPTDPLMKPIIATSKVSETEKGIALDDSPQLYSYGTGPLGDAPADLSVSAIQVPVIMEHATQDVYENSGCSIGLAASISKEHNYSKTLQPKKYNLAPLDAINKKPILKSSKNRSQLYQIKSLKHQVKVLRQRCISFKTRLAEAAKMSADIAFQKVTKSMTSAAKLFTNMQFRQTKKKPSGRRFSLKEKILSLSLFKRSPKCYSLLSHCFTLPSKKTLKGLLAQVKLGPGINTRVFEKLTKTVKEMAVEDRLCCIIFDEMSLTPQITYDMVNDKLKGFISTGHENIIADHVLVFMVKCIKANFKQPVAYYFTNSLTRNKLKNIIKEVIHEVQATGLIPLCSVCDQSTVNVGAINDLVQEAKSKVLRVGQEWRYEYYEINKQKIIPLYDVPHLIKGLRNNLLTKDLQYIDANDSNKEKILKWSYFKDIYEADKSFGELRLLNKITEEHINPDKIKKMRVKSAAQIFSHSVAVAAEHLTARGVLSKECRNVIPFVTLVDNLFDSLNSNSFHIPNGKIYKGCVKRSSPHHQLWCKAKILLKSIKFIATKKSGEKIRLVTNTVPTTNNFIKTIEGFEALWNILSKKYKFDSMLTRNFNQDPVENFFGNIRSYGARNNSPNSVAFEGAYKALLLNNFNSPHSINANCENDENVCLQTLDFFITDSQQASQIAKDVPEEIGLNEEIFVNKEEETDMGQRNYVCGWVVRKCLMNIVKGCVTCKSKLICNNYNECNEYIKLREYNKNKKWQTYPSEEAVNFFYEIQHNTCLFLKQNVPRTDIRSKIKLMTNMLTDFDFQCEQHKDQLKEFFIRTTIHVIVNSWCREINRILAGKISYDGDDEIKNAAQLYYNKRKHYKELK